MPILGNIRVHLISRLDRILMRTAVYVELKFMSLTRCK